MCHNMRKNLEIRLYSVYAPHYLYKDKKEAASFGWLIWLGLGNA